jgi:RNA polymerase sigma-70 factor (ECF subfamily)
MTRTMEPPVAYPPADPRPEFEALVEPLLGRAAGYAYSLLGHRADAEDAVQDALLKGYDRRGGYDPGRPFAGWWFAVVRNCCHDLARRRRRRRPTHTLEQADRMKAGPAAPAATEDLREALGRLAPAHGEVLRLRYFAGCSYREIAQALGIPEGTVMSRLHAARQALAAEYRQETP